VSCSLCAAPASPSRSSRCPGSSDARNPPEPLCFLDFFAHFSSNSFFALSRKSWTWPWCWSVWECRAPMLAPQKVAFVTLIRPGLHVFPRVFCSHKICITKVFPVLLLLLQDDWHLSLSGAGGWQVAPAEVMEGRHGKHHLRHSGPNAGHAIVRRRFCRCPVHHYTMVLLVLDIWAPRSTTMAP